MALDGLVISNIVYELSETLTGGRINKTLFSRNRML